MKPRPPVLVWTEDDAAIWQRWAVHRPLYGFLLLHSFEQDRGDADQVLRRENFRQQCADLRVPQMPPRIWYFVYLPGAA